jgi:hypothetical protein
MTELSLAPVSPNPSQNSKVGHNAKIARGGESIMTTDLKYLAFTAILTASLWIPYVIAQVVTNGPLAPPNYVDPTQRPLPPWGKRADRA